MNKLIKAVYATLIVIGIIIAIGIAGAIDTGQRWFSLTSSMRAIGWMWGIGIREIERSCAVLHKLGRGSGKQEAVK